MDPRIGFTPKDAFEIIEEIKGYEEKARELEPLFTKGGFEQTWMDIQRLNFLEFQKIFNKNPEQELIDMIRAKIVNILDTDNLDLNLNKKKGA